MTSFVRAIRHFAVAALLPCAAFLLPGCDSARRASVGAARGDLPDQEVTDFVLTETDEAKPQWTLYSQYAATYTERNLVVARAVRVVFFDESGKQTSELRAREGELNQLTRDMTARGDVVMQTAEGTRMSTQELRFLNRENRIRSDVDVRIEKQGNTLTGRGFESDPELRAFEFKSKVKATVRTQSGGILRERETKP